MSIKDNILKQIPIYFSGNILIMAASLISFPIFTRFLSKDDYGLMSLINVTVMFVYLFTSCSLKQALYRFYEEYNKQGSLNNFLFVMIWGSSFLGIIGLSIMLLISSVGYHYGLFLKKTYWLLCLASFLVPTKILIDIVTGIFRIQEAAFVYNLFKVLNKYIGIILSIIFIYYFSMGVKGFFLGLVIAEITITLLLLSWTIKKYGRNIIYFSRKIFISMIKYSFPLVFSGLSSFFLNIGDRYLIGYFMNLEDVASYSVVYNLTNYIEQVIIMSVNATIYPIIMNAWTRNKEEEVREVLNKYLIYYSMIAFPIIFGLSSVKNEAIVTLASAKYLDSASLIPYLITGVMVIGFSFPFTAILHKEKKTTTIAFITLGAAALNLGLNIFLIPLCGIKGAAFATLISFIFMVISFRLNSFQKIPITIPYKKFLKFILLSSLMVIPLKNINLIHYSTINKLICKITIGIAIYLIAIIICDRDARNLARAYTIKLSFHKN